MGKKFLIVLGIILALLIGLVLAKDLIIKSAIEFGGSKALGTKVRLSGFHLSFSKQSVELNGLTVANPDGFPSGDMIAIDDIKVACLLQDLKEKKVHLTEVTFSVKELALIRNAQGKLNVESLKGSGSEEKNGGKKEKPAQGKAEYSFLIDKLTIAAPKVTYTELSPATANAQPQNFNLKFNKTYTNVDSVEKLTWLLITDVTKEAGLKSVAAIGSKALQGVGFATDEAKGLIGAVTGTLFGDKEK